MSRKFFGTDGIRSRVGVEPVTPELIVKLGWAAGTVLAAQTEGRAKVLIGKDTRISGYLLESALEAGLSAAGVDVSLIGPMPTPAIAYLTRTARAVAGIVISASHNPYYDNGIKFFSPKGFKLDDRIELEIEARMEQPIKTVDAANLGKAVRFNDAGGRYIEYCKSTFPQRQTLAGLNLVIDCANGAAYNVAPDVFMELGANVTAIGVHPNGLNINDGCGSTDVSLLSSTVKRTGADLGIALDGDADRLIIVDSKGETVNGDQVLYLIAKYRHLANKLSGGVVGTVMSNLALEQAFTALGIEFARSQVGDRYVLTQLQKKGWLVGGETSGHIICLDKNTTGDGINAALEVLSVIVSQQKPLHDLIKELSLFPQNMVNIRLPEGVKFDPSISDEISNEVKKAENYLSSKGRVILRPSGTEPLIRVMVEAEHAEIAVQVSESLAQVVKKFAK